jgi:hypothetical protein
MFGADTEEQRTSLVLIAIQRMSIEELKTVKQMIAEEIRLQKHKSMPIISSDEDSPQTGV